MVLCLPRSVEGQLAVAVKKLEDDWRLKDDVLVRTLARRPQVSPAAVLVRARAAVPSASVCS